ncbi:MAG: serine hydrolase domain-containing protein [Planctomycetota bacterium]
MRRVQVIFAAFVLMAASAFSGDAVAPDFGMPATGIYNSDLLSFDETMTGFMKRNAIPGGSFALVQNGKLIYARAYGFADRDAKTPAQPTTLFRLASVSKPITAVAIMTLVEAKKLNLDAKVVELLGIDPFFRIPFQVDARVRDITVRHLLQHSSGWDRTKSGDIMFKHFQIAEDMGIASPPDHASLLRWGFGRPLDFAPGTKFAYSNFGYCVLGRIIEKVSGQPYEAYVKEHVLGPMGIRGMRIGGARARERVENETAYYDAKNQTVKNVFSEDGPELVPVQYGFNSTGTMDAHGGWIASAVDMARFAAALDHPGEHPVINAESSAHMIERPAKPLGVKGDGTSADVFYGLGWNVRLVDRAGKANVFHSGAMPGTWTLLVRLANGRSWVALFNQRLENTTKDNIDTLLHAAAAKVKTWPTDDLFGSFP